MRGAEVCRFCGADLDASAGASGEPPKKSRLGIVHYLALAGVTLILVILLAALLLPRMLTDF